MVLDCIRRPNSRRFGTPLCTRTDGFIITSHRAQEPKCFFIGDIVEMFSGMDSERGDPSFRFTSVHLIQDDRRVHSSVPAYQETRHNRII